MIGRIGFHTRGGKELKVHQDYSLLNSPFERDSFGRPGIR